MSKNETWYYAKHNGVWRAAGIIPRAKELITLEGCSFILDRIYGPNRIVTDEPSRSNGSYHYWQFNGSSANEFYLCDTNQDINNSGIHQTIRTWQFDKSLFR